MARIGYTLAKIIGKITRNNANVMYRYFRNAGVNIAKTARVYSDIVTPEAYLITIGEYTTISFDVCLITHDNSAEKLQVGISDMFGRITIGNRCFIGARAIIMPGVTLGNHCIVGAGAVVTKSFPDYSIIAGNPAKIVSDFHKYREFVINNGFKIDNLTPPPAA